MSFRWSPGCVCCKCKEKLLGFGATDQGIAAGEHGYYDSAQDVVAFNLGTFSVISELPTTFARNAIVFDTSGIDISAVGSLLMRVRLSQPPQNIGWIAAGLELSDTLPQTNAEFDARQTGLSTVGIQQDFGNIGDVTDVDISALIPATDADNVILYWRPDGASQGRLQFDQVSLVITADLLDDWVLHPLDPPRTADELALLKDHRIIDDGLFIVSKKDYIREQDSWYYRLRMENADRFASTCRYRITSQMKSTFAEYIDPNYIDNYYEDSYFDQVWGEWELLSDKEAAILDDGRTSDTGDPAEWPVKWYLQLSMGEIRGGITSYWDTTWYAEELTDPNYMEAILCRTRDYDNFALGVGKLDLEGLTSYS